METWAVARWTEMACVSEQPKELRSFDSGEDFIPYLR